MSYIKHIFNVNIGDDVYILDINGKIQYEGVLNKIQKKNFSYYDVLLDKEWISFYPKTTNYQSDDHQIMVNKLSFDNDKFNNSIKSFSDVIDKNIRFLVSKLSNDDKEEVVELLKNMESILNPYINNDDAKKLKSVQSFYGNRELSLEAINDRFIHNLVLTSHHYVDIEKLLDNND